MDADGKADYCRLVGNAGADERAMCTVSAGGTAFSDEYVTQAVGWGTAPQSWADFDGDGMLDFCRAFDNGSGNQRAGCVRIDAATYQSTALPLSEPLVLGDAAFRAWADVTGDQQADFCRVTGANPDARLTCIVSNGTDFQAPTPTPTPTPSASAAPTPSATTTPTAATPTGKTAATVTSFWDVSRPAPAPPS